MTEYKKPAQVLAHESGQGMETSAANVTSVNNFSTVAGHGQAKKMTLRDAIDMVKARVSARELCDLAGITVNAAGKALCPWHDDSRPSLQVYPGQRGVYCFACGQGGSVIDLAMAVYHIPLRDAVKRLAADFNLQIELDGNAGRDTPAPVNFRRLYERELHSHAEDLKDTARLVELAIGGQSAELETAIDELETRLYNERRCRDEPVS